MQIKLIDQTTHNELKNIAEEYPELIFQNEGYQYIGREKREKHKDQLARISEILKQHITGFSHFDNFRMDNDRLVLRFQYNWGEEDNSMRYTGVGYLSLDELLNGFDKIENSETL